MQNYKIFLGLTFLLSLSAQANELIRSGAELQLEGYEKVETSNQFFKTGAVPEAHSLSWPVAFQDSEHTIGNSMAEFQPFDNPPYFHGGCDLRVSANAPVYAPLAGKLEAGHYGYETNPDGSMTKFWRAWPLSGDPTYFEVAVIGDDGTRYEFHHMNRENLPREIITLLNAGGGRINKGDLLGFVIPWPGGGYHHTHYNIVLPDGIRVNPEYASTLLADSFAPEITGAYAIGPSDEVSLLGSGRVSSSTREFVLEVHDRQDKNIYSHPPTLVRLRFKSGQETTWDFRSTLTAQDGKFPPIWNFFREMLRSPDGSTHYTDGGFGTGQSLIRLPIPKGAVGDFSIEVGDIAGNIRQISGSIGL